jgi:hypothetical protein
LRDFAESNIERLRDFAVSGTEKFEPGRVCGRRVKRFCRIRLRKVERFCSVRLRKVERFCRVRLRKVERSFRDKNRPNDDRVDSHPCPLPPPVQLKTFEKQKDTFERFHNSLYLHTSVLLTKKMSETGKRKLRIFTLKKIRFLKHNNTKLAEFLI